MNSLSFDLLRALQKEVEAIRFMPDVRVVIITGAGEKAFCSGADLKERATMSPPQVKEYILTIRNLFTAIEYLNKPVIAAVNGIALGGGTELALASDIRIVSKTALMGLTETRLAIIPGAGGTQRLPRLVGKGKAKELIFTGRRVGADEALTIGLANQICEPDQLLDRSLQNGCHDSAKPDPSPSNRPNTPSTMALKPIFPPGWPLNPMPTGCASRPRTGWRALPLFAKNENRCTRECNTANGL